jgi:hypothetical protein
MSACRWASLMLSAEAADLPEDPLGFAEFRFTVGLGTAQQLIELANTNEEIANLLNYIKVRENDGCDQR